MKTYYFEFTIRAAIKAESEEEARRDLNDQFSVPESEDFTLTDVVEDSDEPTQPGTQVIDLMAALKASLARKA